MKVFQVRSWKVAFARVALIGATLALTLMGNPDEARAENLIKSPGAHNRYSWELEPRIGFFYGGRGYGDFYRDDFGAFGPGVHASIPFMHNGPIDTINNNIGINFGIDTYFPDGGSIWSVPVAFQWNFYFTDVISVLGEVGLTTIFWGGDRFRGRNVDIDPVFQGGGRFQFGKVGVLVRLGWPSVGVGCNIQF